MVLGSNRSVLGISGRTLLSSHISAHCCHQQQLRRSSCSHGDFFQRVCMLLGIFALLSGAAFESMMDAAAASVADRVSVAVAQKNMMRRMAQNMYASRVMATHAPDFNDGFEELVADLVKKLAARKRTEAMWLLLTSLAKKGNGRL